MSSYGRHGVLNGETIDLRVVFTDDSGNLQDADSFPLVYIFDDSLTDDELATAIETSDFTNSVAGPFTAVEIAPGYYQYEYTVPSTAEDAVWRDVWVGTMNDAQVVQLFSFKVVRGPNLTTQRLGMNQLIVIQLDAGITSYDGEKDLGSDIQLSFLTVLKPYYTSVDLVRMEAGAWLDFIPDSTLAMMIYWSSKEADFIGNSPCNTDDYKFALSKFVIFDAALRALTLPGGATVVRGGGFPTSGKRKSLGDLMIDNGSIGASLPTTASGLDLETWKYFKSQRDEWWRVVNAGGCIVPGQSLDPGYAVKGKYDPDRRNSGRLWGSPDDYAYSQPGANFKFRPTRGNRHKFGFASYRRDEVYPTFKK